MKALLSLNENNFKEIEASTEEDLLLFTKDYFLNDLDDSIDEMNEQIYGYIETDECLVDLQEQVEALERKADKLQVADDMAAVRRLGYNVTLV